MRIKYHKNYIVKIYWPRPPPSPMPPLRVAVRGEGIVDKVAPLTTVYSFQ